MSDMEDTGENHKCETNSSFQTSSSASSSRTTSSAAGSAAEGHFPEEACNSRHSEASLPLEVYRPPEVLLTLNTTNGGGGGGSGVSPMEASTQTLDCPGPETTICGVRKETETNDLGLDTVVPKCLAHYPKSLLNDP
jgi:hypothetical protein